MAELGWDLTDLLYSHTKESVAQRCLRMRVGQMLMDGEDM